MTHRIPYDVTWDDDGEIGTHQGTCLPIEAHSLMANFMFGEPSWSISCPDDGCVKTDVLENSSNGTCWLKEWFDNVGTEMIDSDRDRHALKLALSIEQGPNSQDEAPTIKVVGFKYAESPVDGL